ncbi:MAG: ATP-binding protein [Patescibacteria group bacterium]
MNNSLKTINNTQPTEDGFVTISRSSGRANFPAKFMLIGAQNPCP